MPSSAMISLVIPAYNEEETIGKVISSTIDVMKKLGYSFEIIVVDDGSTDKTKLAALSSRKEVKIFSNGINRGKGYCLRKAAKYINGDILVTLDSDGEHNPKEIPALLAPILEGTDIVAGSRFLGATKEVTSKLNNVGNHFFNLAIMVLTGKHVSDSQTGFRAMKRGIFEQLNLQSDGYEIETEITVKSLMNGFTFKEVPITLERRKYDVSKIKVFSDGKKILSTIIRASFSPLIHTVENA